MTWFRVDDKFGDHPKVRKLRGDKAPAVGVWTLCGTWSADNLSDGFVPTEVVQRFDPKERYAKRLVDVGLWTVTEQDSETGYQFHQWDEHQPTRAQVQKRRNDTKKRVQEWRTRNASQETPREHLGNGTGNALHDPYVTPLVTPPPTRPDPTRPLVDGQVRGEGPEVDRASGDTPPAPHRCPRHQHLPADDPGPPCVGCRDRRLALEAEAKRPRPVVVPEWCGECEHPDTRQIELDDGRIARCPRCHPHRSRDRKAEPA